MRVKISLFGVSGIILGKHNLKDPRLDQADKLAEAERKTCAQVDVVDEKELSTADAILTSRAALSDLLMKDLDFVETRLSRDASEAEKAVLHKLAEVLISEQPVSAAGLTAEELAAISAHNFLSSKPVIAASDEELKAPEAVLLRAYRESGWICFLTVGGKENRAWPIRVGATAAEAAGTIHTDLQKGRSAPKSSASPILSNTAARRVPSAPARCGPNSRPTTCRITTWPTSAPASSRRTAKPYPCS